MDRLAELRRHVAPGAKGIEIAPYFNPVVPKSAGYDVLIVDVFDTDRLRQNASLDPKIPDSRIAEIEPVDIVCDASNLGSEVERLGLTGRIDYIISSHNFEHLPDPIRFLKGCGQALRPGGMLTMAIPDYRACFDHYRMPTRLTDWLSAYQEGRSQPSPASIFDFLSYFSQRSAGGQNLETCRIEHDDPSGFAPTRDFAQLYSDYLGRMSEPKGYEDIHCSTVFGELFELLILELRYLGLIDLEAVQVTRTHGHEFFAHLTKAAPEAALMPRDVFDARRLELLKIVNANLGSAVFANRPRQMPRPSAVAKRMFAAVVGAGAANRLRRWNRARKARRKPPASAA
jgi:SAM-dependent methyltransferase